MRYSEQFQEVLSSIRTGYVASRFSLWALLLAFLFPALQPAFAQRGGGSSGVNNGASGGLGNSAPSMGRSTSNFPGSNPSPGYSTASRPVFFFGKVLLDDGSKPNGDIRIERVCNGAPRLEGHTDSKGQFSFQVGQSSMLDTDAADPMSGGLGSPGGIGNSTSGGSGIGRSGQGNALWGCELRAAYPGYRSDTVDLGHYRADGDLDTDIGTIILHRLGGTAAGTISVADALVPKQARKAYEKGVQFAVKRDFEQAEKRFEEATDAYPKYAMAWFALGELQQKRGDATDAAKSYEAAVAANGSYAEAYDRLALLAVQREDWEATAKYSKQAVQLDSVDYPTSLWYNAIANFQLKKPDDAEKSVQELLRIDKGHHYPEAERMYGQLLLSRGEDKEAAAHLRAYLALTPNAQGAVEARQVLAKLDANAAGK